MDSLPIASSATSGISNILWVVPCVCVGVFLLTMLLFVHARNGRMHGYASLTSLVTRLVFYGAFIAPFFVIPSFLRNEPRAVDSLLGGTISQAGDAGDDSMSSAAASSAAASPTSQASDDSTSSAAASPTSHPTSHHATHIPWAWVGFVAAIILVVLACAVAAFIARAWASEKVAIRKAKVDEVKRNIAERAELERQWQILHERLDQATKEWDRYENDPTLYLKQPAIRDVSVPEVAKVIRGLQRANEVKTIHAPSGISTVSTTDYAQAIAGIERDIPAAVRITKRMVDTHMSASERKTLIEAQRLLALVLNDATASGERQIAYERLQRCLDRLKIEIPQVTLQEIERRHLRLLTA